MAPKRKKRSVALVEEIVPEPQPIEEEPPPVEEEQLGDVDPAKCEVHGLDDHDGITVRTPNEFTIVARDSKGNARREGGDGFFIAIRGASRVRARVADSGDGTYRVEWKPIVSGDYTVAVSLFGVSLPGSPFGLHVYDPSPYAPRCEATGEALNYIAARNSFSFDMRFRDRGGNIAQAVDLDVFVEPLPSDPESAAIFSQAWAGATRLCDEPEEARSVPITAAADAEIRDELQIASTRKKSRRSTAAQQEPGAAAPAAANAPLVEFQQTVPQQVTGGLETSEPEADSIGANERAVEPEAIATDDVALTRQRAIRIRVGRRPLIVRASPSLDSKQIAVLLAGQTVTVVEERINDGYVRARVTFDENQPGSPNTARMRTGSSAGDSAMSVATLTSRSPSPSPPNSPGGSKLLSGWVTLKKHGKNLVTSRLKLETTRKREHIEQWDRRQRNDKLHNDVTNELAVDPTGVGFAFGGVYPGYLHAKGRLHEKHTVSYSVGRVGRYLLHVRLRQQALPVPGSPFALTVRPGAADPRATSVATLGAVPLRGSVGLSADDGCKLIIKTADLMGNECVSGGAGVKTMCDLDAVQADAVDLNDGSYELQWRSKLSGTFSAKVMIGNTQVKGSPIKIKLTSTVPELARCELDGEGVKHAIAGQPASVRILFYDSYGNSASPGPECKVGIGLTHQGDKKKITDVKAYTFEGGWGEEDSGEYFVTYMPREAGNHELHVWCDPNDKGERVALPGSPFTVHVVAGAPTASRSHVEGFTKESRQADRSSGKAHKQQSSGDPSAGSSMIIAGDQVSVRPLVVDEFGNPSKLIEGTMNISLVKPDGSSGELALQTSYVKASGLAQYEVKCDTHLAGKHAMHITLKGEPITGSPVTFDVHPSGPDPEHSVLVPPEGHEALAADYDKPSIVVLKTHDRFGNACAHGGLVPTGRLSLVKQNAADQTLLMPNNHFVAVEDMHDGTYAIKIGIKMPATVKLFINMDKNLPSGGGELPALQITFGTPHAAQDPENDACIPHNTPRRGSVNFADRVTTSSSPPPPSPQPSAPAKLRSVAELNELISRYEGQAGAAGGDASIAARLGEVFRKSGLKPEQLVRELDPNGDGSVTKMEFRQKVRQHLEKGGGAKVDVRQCDALFESWDKDKGGTLENDEITRALKQLQAAAANKASHDASDAAHKEAARKCALAAKHARDVTSVLEGTHDKIRTLLETRDVGALLGEWLNARNLKIADFIAKFDKDGDGSVDPHEFVKTVKAFGFKPPPASLRDVAAGKADKRAAASSKADEDERLTAMLYELFERLDKDGGGSLDKEELHVALKRLEEEDAEVKDHIKALKATTIPEQRQAAGVAQHALLQAEADSEAQLAAEEAQHAQVAEAKAARLAEAKARKEAAAAEAEAVSAAEKAEFDAHLAVKRGEGGKLQAYPQKGR